MQTLYILSVYFIVFTQASIWKYATESSNIPPPKVLHSTISYKNLTTNEDLIVIFGGYFSIDDTKSQTSSAIGIRTNDAYKYSVQTRTWTMINPDFNSNETTFPYFPTSRALHSATYIPHNAPSYGDCMFVYGGDLDDPEYTPRLVALNLSTDTWIIKDNTTSWFFDPSSYVNSRRQPVFEYSRFDHSLILFAGGLKNGFPEGSMFKFFLENETWVELLPTDSSAAKPSARARGVSSISEDGRYLYVFGGNAFSGIPTTKECYSDLWRFDLLLRVWMLLSSGFGQLATPIESSQMFYLNDQTLWLLPYDTPGYSSIFPVSDRDNGKWHAYQYRLDLNEWRNDPIRSEGSIDPKWSLWYTACLIKNLTFNNESYLAIIGGQVYNGNISIAVNDVRLLSFEIGIPNSPAISTTTNSNQSSDNKNVTLIVAIVIPIIVVLLLVILVVGIIYRRKSNRKNLMTEYGQEKSFPMKNILTECQIHDIRIDQKLGGGKFGEVFKGYWQKSTPVACKRLKADDHLKNFEQEAMMLKSLNHPNVVQFFGIYTDEDNHQYIVTEFMPNGSLSQLFMKEKNLSIKDLLRMCRDTAAGMMYVSESHKIVHRDLALRNLLVTDREGQYMVKVSDLGLARATNDEGHYLAQASQFPVKWTSPEAIQYRTFSDKSDIWSFGVTAWEILSQGQEPYYGMDNNETVEKVLNGYRLPKPSNETPDVVYQLILDCWNLEPSMRPSFRSIHQTLRNALNEI